MNRTIKLFLGIWAVYSLFGYLRLESISGQLVDLGLSVVKYGTVNLTHVAGMEDLSVRNGGYLPGHFPGGALPIILLGYFLEPLLFMLPQGGGLILMNLASVFLVSTVFGALTAVVFYKFLGLFSMKEVDRVLFTLIFAFGTMNFNYASSLYKVNQVTLYLFFAFFLLYRYSRIGGKGRRDLFFAGFLCGLAFITHPVYVSICLPLLIYAFLVSGTGGAFAFISGGVGPCLALALYLKAAFGGILDHPYAFRDASDGLFKYTVPGMSRLFRLFLGPKGGFFLYMPVILFSFTGIYRALKERDFMREAVIIAAGAVLTGLLFSGWVYAAPPDDVVFPHDAGITCRFLAPLCPFLMLLAARGAAGRKGLMFRAMAGASLFFSYLGVQAGFIPTDSGWQVVYAVKVLVTSFGMPYIFSNVIPETIGAGTFHGFMSAPETGAGTLFSAGFGYAASLIGNQLLILCLFLAAVWPVLSYLKHIMDNAGKVQDAG